MTYSTVPYAAQYPLSTDRLKQLYNRFLPFTSNKEIAGFVDITLRKAHALRWNDEALLSELGTPENHEAFFDIVLRIDNMAAPAPIRRVRSGGTAEVVSFSHFRQKQLAKGRDQIALSRESSRLLYDVYTSLKPEETLAPLLTAEAPEDTKNLAGQVIAVFSDLKAANFSSVNRSQLEGLYETSKLLDALIQQSFSEMNRISQAELHISLRYLKCATDLNTVLDEVSSLQQPSFRS